jgi:hypothetical protein
MGLDNDLREPPVRGLRRQDCTENQLSRGKSDGAPHANDILTGRMLLSSNPYENVIAPPDKASNRFFTKRHNQNLCGRSHADPVHDKQAYRCE